jgi:tetratricopeptide (TPR) repeat protein
MYRYLTLLLAFCGITDAAIAQTDTTLKFNQIFTRAERKWVAFPKKPTETRYPYGYIYIDPVAGFTFDMKGFFEIDAQSHYLPDTSMTKNSSYKIRLSEKTAKVAVLSPAHFNELHVTPEPDWVKLYYRYTDTVARNFKVGFACNAAGDCTMALTYLQKVYQAKPDYPGLIFELSYAYNALNRSEEAISLLLIANKKDPQNKMFYRELGYAYMNKNDKDKAIDYFKQGIAHCKDGIDDEKAEMAYNMAAVYKKNANADEYKNWMQKAKEWSTAESNLHKALVAQGF